MLTRDLKKSNDNLVVHGKLILNLSTNLSQPIGPATMPSRPSVSNPPSTNGVPHVATPVQSTTSLHPDLYPGNRPGTQSQRSSTVNSASPQVAPAPVTPQNGIVAPRPPQQQPRTFNAFE